MAAIVSIASGMLEFGIALSGRVRSWSAGGLRAQFSACCLVIRSHGVRSAGVTGGCAGGAAQVACEVGTYQGVAVVAAVP